MTKTVSLQQEFHSFISTRFQMSLNVSSSHIDTVDPQETFDEIFPKKTLWPQNKHKGSTWIVGYRLFTCSTFSIVKTIINPLAIKNAATVATARVGMFCKFHPSCASPSAWLECALTICILCLAAAKTANQNNASIYRRCHFIKCWIKLILQESYLRVFPTVELRCTLQHTGKQIKL
jgi:hypothetical protein